MAKVKTSGTAGAKRTVSKLRKPSVRERIAANRAAKIKAGAVKHMTPDERRKAIERVERELAEYAPSIDAVESDLLRMLLVIGAEFVDRYFPGASSANLTITKYPDNGHCPPEYSVMIPMSVDRAEGR
jgi:hypothetical protein